MSTIKKSIQGCFFTVWLAVLWYTCCGGLFIIRRGRLLWLWYENHDGGGGGNKYKRRDGGELVGISRPGLTQDYTKAA